MKSVEWHRLKSFEQIVEENPDYKPDKEVNDITTYSTISLRNEKNKKEWTINDQMLEIMGDGKEYPFTNLELGELSHKSYTHRIVPDIITNNTGIITSDWVFTELWFEEESLIIFDDKDFYI